MGTVRSSLIVLLVAAALLAAACGPADSGLPNEAARQVLFLAAEGSTIVSTQFSAEGFVGRDAWCVVTENAAGKERWVVLREAQEGQRDTYSLIPPKSPRDFAVLGCTNWDD
jgi:hypothetical protein